MTQPPNPGQYPYQPPPQYAPTPRQKKSHTVRNVLLILLGVFVLGFAGCIALVGGAAKSIDNESKRVVAVEYQVAGDAPDVSINYTTFSGANSGTSTESNAKLPWQQTSQVSGLGKTVILSVSTGNKGGDVTCRILSGGKVLTEQHASGVYAHASCTTSLH